MGVMVCRAEGHHERSQLPALEYQPLLLALAAAASGILLDRAISLPLGLWWLAGVAACALWWPLWRRRRQRVASICLLATLGAIAGGWHHARWNLVQVDDLGLFATDESQPACVDVLVRGPPRRVPPPPPDVYSPYSHGEQTRLSLEALRLRDGQRWRRVSGRLELNIDGPLQGIASGDRVRIVGQLSACRSALNPGEFDYAQYARADGVRCRLFAVSPECVQLLERGHWGPSRMWGALRAGGDRLLEEYLSQRQIGLAAGMLLGLREQIDPRDAAAFQETGTAHLLCISGLHIGMLAGFVWVLLRWGWLPRSITLLLVGAVTVVYALVIDAGPPAARATIMVLLACVAAHVGRRALGFNVLAGAALVVLAINPADLFRTGPQLSFLAAAVLVGMAPVWRRWQERDALDRLLASTRPWPMKAMSAAGTWFAHALVVSCAVWLATLPLVMSRFHVASAATLLLTPLLLWPMAVALFSGFVVLLTGSWLWPVAVVSAAVCDAALRFIQWSVDIGQTAPGGTWWVAGPPLWWMVIFYVGLGVWWFAPRVKYRGRWGVAIAGGWCLCLPLVTHPGTHDELRCTFLAVGHGSSTLLELPGGRTLLYDAGQLGSSHAAGRTVSAVLWQRGISRVDDVVISHADVDHYNALPVLLKRFDVGTIHAPADMLAARETAVRALLAAAQEAGVPVVPIHRGQFLADEPGVQVTVLHPPEQPIDDADNANSVVLLLEAAGRRILLAGDLEGSGQRLLMEGPSLPCDVALAPHHGSLGSNTPQWADWCRAGHVVVSSNRADAARLADIYRPSGAQLLVTSEVGAVTVRVRRGECLLSAVRAPQEATIPPLYQAVQPPSTVTTEPVMYAEASETMNSTGP